MGFDPHGEVFYGYDLGDLTAPTPGGDDRWDRTYVGPAWMLDDPGDPDSGIEDYDPAAELARIGGWVEAVPFPGREVFELPREQREAHRGYAAWSADQLARRTAIARVDQGCTLAAYGGHEGEHPDGVRLRVAIRESIVRVSYECESLEPVLDAIPYDGTWNVRLRTYAAQLGIPVPEAGAGWHLTSDYG